jgi:putative ATP-binding cassette transporter
MRLFAMKIDPKPARRQPPRSSSAPAAGRKARATAQAETERPCEPKSTTRENAAALQVQDFDLARDAALFGRALRKEKGAKLVLSIFVASSVITLCSMIGNVRLNKWNGQFFDAISRKDLGDFFHQIEIFLPLIAILLALTVTQTFLQERLKFRLREWISRHLLNEWLRPMRIYQMGFVGEAGRNPDQRIQEDTRLLGDYTSDLACGAVSSFLQITAFIGVLWALSAQVVFEVNGHNVAIPGYMVWCALLYALIGSGLTWLVGRPLIRLNSERYMREAELRFALVRANECAESIALHRGEKDEKAYLQGALANVVDVMRRLSTSLAQLTWITSGTGWLSIIVPMVVAAPAYFHGSLTLGNLIMVAGAFGQVQGAMRWFVDNFSRLADWRAAVHRVARFRAALDDLPAVEEGATEIERRVNPEGHLALENLRILRPDGTIVIEDASVSVKPGDRVLIVGETGAGKSTLFRAIAGLWPWGAGQILTPPRDEIAFLPQRPYIPLGPLRYALTYPGTPESVSDDDLKKALERCNLGEFMDRLDETARWDKEMSLGEQQRLAFARLSLNKPQWVFLDEATAALDQESQDRVMSLFDDELKDSTLLSIGHRPDLAEYHTRTLQLVHDPSGDRLKIKPSGTAVPPSRWAHRIARLLTVGRPKGAANGIV